MLIETRQDERPGHGVAEGERLDASWAAVANSSAAESCPATSTRTRSSTRENAWRRCISVSSSSVGDPDRGRRPGRKVPLAELRQRVGRGQPHRRRCVVVTEHNQVLARLGRPKHRRSRLAGVPNGVVAALPFGEVKPPAATKASTNSSRLAARPPLRVVTVTSRTVSTKAWSMPRCSIGAALPAGQVAHRGRAASASPRW